ncbi:oxysterol-binding protein-related protein 1-like isoform X2 [Sphaeramia orbicularis]|uniref:oxysterol-binding protein-related protein 1-like isoform X2 n=1 Tax=Sphaeramia orbicularis TaxID=375764 RepID=UPI00117D9A58|nr:oxysterol-binding protein-related protein 1-like isoform X2 [Sphaeramia orbicularis]
MTALDLARTDELRQILAAYLSKDVSNGVQKIEGPLWKSSRFLGWRSHWVVIEDGSISWYPRQGDAMAGVRKQGCKSLSQAYCMVPSKTNSIATRKKWMDAVEAHSSYSIRHCIQEQISDDGNSNMALGNLSQALQTANMCQEKLESEVSIFLSLVKNEENSALAAPILLKAKETSELSKETCSALRLCFELLSKQEEVW